MKISFMTFACPEWSFQEVVKAATRHGYDGIEFRIDAHHAHGVEVSALADERKAFRDAVNKARLELPCLATSLQFANELSIEGLADRLDLAADIGAKALRVFCGPPSAGADMSTTINIVADNLRSSAQAAEAAGVELWLETHDTFSKAHDAATAVRHANHPSLGINYDNMHPFRMGEDLETTFASITGLIRHCHLHDAVNDPNQVIVTPLGKGDMPMQDMFDQLLRSGFDGYISGEWFADQYGDSPDDSLARYIEDMNRLATMHGMRLGA